MVGILNPDDDTSRAMTGVWRLDSASSDAFTEAEFDQVSFVGHLP